MSIKIDLKIFLFLFLFLLTSQIEIYIILFVFAIIHELGHMIAGIVLKLKPEEIKLSPVGVSINFIVDSEEYNIENQKSKTSDIKKAIIAIAGPMTNLIIVTVAIILAKINNEFTNMYIYQVIVYSNFLIAMFNLIPIYPMDGGRALKQILKISVGNKMAYKITYIVSKTILIILTIISSIAILYTHNVAILLIIAYIWYLEIVEIRKYNIRKRIESIQKSMV